MDPYKHNYLNLKNAQHLLKVFMTIPKGIGG